MPGQASGRHRKRRPSPVPRGRVPVADTWPPGSDLRRAEWFPPKPWENTGTSLRPRIVGASVSQRSTDPSGVSQ